jgi:hypothetical protein
VQKNSRNESPVTRTPWLAEIKTLKLVPKKFDEAMCETEAALLLM